MAVFGKAGTFHNHLMRSISWTLLASLLIMFSDDALAGFKMVKDPDLPKTKLKEGPIVSSKDPVLLTANEMHYDQENSVVFATGSVQVAQGDTIVLADVLTYDQIRDEVKAQGHVSMLEPSGNVYFADELVLQDDLKAGVVHQFKARLADNSVFVASGARKIDDEHMELFKTAYTPCKCDRDGKPRTPMWQIRADHAIIDQELKEVRYEDATLDAFGIPVIYTPYFSHPTPGAGNESGLLMPEFLHTTNLGPTFKQPVYYSIAPDKDVTVTPIYTGKEGLVMSGQYRQMFDDGPLNIAGSITDAQNRNGLGERTAGHEIRGNIDARGAFKINDNYDWGLDVRRALDDTYLRFYNFSNETLLTSKIYAEGFNFVGDGQRNYASMQALSFQGLTGQDSAKVIPVVAPLMDFTYQSDPGRYNSRFLFDANSMLLFRQNGAESRRLSGTAGWKLPYISENGQVIEFATHMRTDIYDVNAVQLSDGRTYNGMTGRAIPEASLTWRYPFINRMDNSSLMVEPIVEFVASPGGGNPEKIPNEDSLLPEFTDTNLFVADRFAGLDRVENGPRMSYGMRGQAELYSDKYIDWLFGQHYRLNNDPTFPFSNDLTSHWSDYVGKVGFTYMPFNVAYRFRLDKDNFSTQRSEVDAGFNYYPIALSTAYLKLRNDPVLASKEIVTGNSSLNLTKEWSWNVGGTRDLQQDQTDTVSTGLAFKNECVNLTTMVGKDYTNILDVKPALTFWFRVSLKNLD